MDQLGAILSAAREQRDLSLSDVNQELKINARFLQALEEGNYDALPSPVHVRGYLRNYATYLGLDPTPLVEEYEAIFTLGRGRRGRNPAEKSTDPNEKPIPPVANNPFFRPSSMELNPQKSAPGFDSVLRWIIIAALLSAIGLIGYRLYLESADRPIQPLVALQETIGTMINGDDVPTAAEIDTEQLIEDAEIPAADDAAIVSTGRNQVGDDGEAAAEAVVDLEQFNGADSYEIRLEITERTWLQVTADGEITFQGYAPGGTTQTFIAENELTLKTGNAYGIYATINGEEVGKLGERAQVIDHTFIAE